MTGPEHFAEAERLVAKAAETPPGTPMHMVNADLAMAQVHATLALAAATALMDPSPDGGLPQLDRDEWERVAETPWPAREPGAPS